MDPSHSSLVGEAADKKDGRRPPIQGCSNQQEAVGHNRVEDDADIEKDYRRDIQRALRALRIKSARGGSWVLSDLVHMEGLTGLPGVTLKGVGRVGLPLGVEQEGWKMLSFVFDVHLRCIWSRWPLACSRWY